MVKNDISKSYQHYLISFIFLKLTFTQPADGKQLPIAKKQYQRPKQIQSYSSIWAIHPPLPY